jgi:DMSO/TMAO reductase YedYZ molybdopterin-dependent catalytic subunit
MEAPMRRPSILFIIASLILFSTLLTTPWRALAEAVPNPLGAEDPDAVRKATALLHTTGEAPEVDLRRWRLKVTGKKTGKTIRLSYRKLAALEQVKRNVVLICPGAFTDRADWEGVPLSTLMEMARIREDFEKIMVFGLDGYAASFTREEVENNTIFLALKVNGVTLPPEHGFPVRIVAEDILGGRWVKWIDYIRID